MKSLIKILIILFPLIAYSHDPMTFRMKTITVPYFIRSGSNQKAIGLDFNASIAIFNGGLQYRYYFNPKSISIISPYVGIGAVNLMQIQYDYFNFIRLKSDCPIYIFKGKKESGSFFDDAIVITVIIEKKVKSDEWNYGIGFGLKF